MDYGQTFIDMNYNAAWINECIAKVQTFSWIFDWGMFLFLLVTIAICVWIFFDSINKKKGQKSLVPRILSIIGIFLILPAFIFRYTGNADGISVVLRLTTADGLTVNYAGPIYWNVKWLVAGYGPAVAMIALAGVIVSVVALVIYMSTVQRARPSTEFVNAVSGLERSVSQIQAQQAQIQQQQMHAAAQASAAGAGREGIASAVRAVTGAGVSSSGTTVLGGSAKTVFDGRPQAATVIDVALSPASLTFLSGARAGQVVRLPQGAATMGRSTGNTVVVDDMKASGQHAQIARVGSDWVITDRNSTNGTFVSGVRLTQPQVLHDGDTIRLGETMMKFLSGE